MPSTTKVLIADDHSLYRNGLRLLLRDELAFECVLEAESFDAAAVCINENPDIEIALFDLAMPGMRGPASLLPLRIGHPSIKFAIVTASEAKSDALAAIEAGLCGFLPKTLECDDFIAALELIRRGGIYVPGLIDRRRRGQALAASKPAEQPTIQNPRTIDPLRKLTAQQGKVLDCVRAGLSNREIAEKLSLSIGIVKVNVSALMTILNVKSRLKLSVFGAIDSVTSRPTEQGSDPPGRRQSD